VRRAAYMGLVIVALTVVGVGCPGPAVVKTVPKTYDNLTKISYAYRKATDTLNRAPNSLNELLPYLKEHGEDTAAFLKSADDNEDFVILWGVDYRTAVPIPVMVHEKHGKGGKRQVLRGHNIFELTDEEFKAAPFPAGYKAPI